MKNTIKFYDTIFPKASVWASDISEVMDKSIFNEYEGKIEGSYNAKDTKELIYLVSYVKGTILVPESLITKNCKNELQQKI